MASRNPERNTRARVSRAVCFALFRLAHNGRAPTPEGARRSVHEWDSQQRESYDCGCRSRGNLRSAALPVFQGDTPKATAQAAVALVASSVSNGGIAFGSDAPCGSIYIDLSVAVAVRWNPLGITGSQDADVDEVRYIMHRIMYHQSTLRIPALCRTGETP